MSLYSPEFTSNPQYWVNAEYMSPSECGKWISLETARAFPFPSAREVVAHSPTPSMVRTAALSKGDGKYALAAWLRWCSLKSIRSSASKVPSSRRSSRASTRLRNNLSCSHAGIDRANAWKPRGANATAVSRIRSNFRKGLS